MNIYIGYDFKKNPIGVLLADNREKADIAWAGMGVSIYSVEEIDPNDQNNRGIHGLIILLTSTEHNTLNYSHKTDGLKFHKWKRGL